MTHEHHEDNVPEPGPEDEDGHYVHMHIEFSVEEIEDQSTGESLDMGIIHMHVHGVPMNTFVETLLTLAVQVTANAMGQGEGPFDSMPSGPQKQKVIEGVAREFLANKIRHSASQALISQVPDDVSSLLEEL